MDANLDAKSGERLLKFPACDAILDAKRALDAKSEAISHFTNQADPPTAKHDAAPRSRAGREKPCAGRESPAPDMKTAAQDISDVSDMSLRILRA
jgi:hypothetical protein